ncbi:HAD family acid phosphatase [Chitinimonas sp. BJYL2]|uniref:HAD family acid phosphatase n=1 Tax=Chitinimonas sp. BJYL2 TaxID=2976696 RepID=UPI0022B3108D|nr:HAD family acid phosphatase [Chitinimonas sp. BJYL2]
MPKLSLFLAALLSAWSTPALAAEPTGANLAKLNAVWWYHLSEEAQLNAQTVYQAAIDQLPSAVRKPGIATLSREATPKGVKTTANAVVLDIDETVLNNSAFNAWLMRENRDYSEAAWQDWVAKGEAKPLPGALDFVRKARALDVQVYYVTNRECVAKDGEACPAESHTIRNLRELGFPDVTPEFLLLKNEQPGWVSDKTGRRSLLAAQGKRIVMLLGDDLRDFLPAAEADALRAGKPSAEAKAALSLFGKRWFMLPNPMYGSWDRAMPANLAARAARLNPPSGWDAPAAATGLKLATWNIAWLANAPLDEPMAQRCEEEARSFRNFDDRPTAVCRNGGPFRRATDYQRLARHAKLVDADILAFQEVEGLDAIQRIMDGKGELSIGTDVIAPGSYVMGAFPGGGWQKVGIAVRKSVLKPGTTPVFKPFSQIGEPLDRDQRGALEAQLELADGSKLTVLALHLKSRCAAGSLNAPTDHCRMLVKQAPILSRWIAAKEKAGERYVILGDFNRELASERAGDADTLTRWIENGEGNLSQAPIIAPTAAFKHPAGCYNPRYPGNSIDHIVLGGGAERGWVAGSVEAVPYRDPQTGAALTDHAKVRDLYSDHCVITTRWQP